MWRRARTAATATPTSTATIRSNATVATAVTVMTTASERVDRKTARTLWISTIRTAVTISTPASAARGIFATRLPPKSTTRMSRSEWSAAADPGAGAGTDVHGRAGDGTGGRHATEQRRDDVGEALPEQLPVGVVTAVSAMPSATLADSRLSMAASRATAKAAESRSRS